MLRRRGEEKGEKGRGRGGNGDGREKSILGQRKVGRLTKMLLVIFLAGLFRGVY